MDDRVVFGGSDTTHRKATVSTLDRIRVNRAKTKCYEMRKPYSRAVMGQGIFISMGRTSCPPN